MKTFIFMVSFIFVNFFVFAQDDKKEESSEKRTQGLNMVSCLLMALEHNKEILVSDLDLKISELFNDASDASFEWQLISRSSYSSVNDTVSESLDIEKSFQTGTSIALGTTVEDRSIAGDDKSSSVSFRITQRLLSGATYKENNLPIFRSGVQYEQAKLRTENKVKEIVNRVANSYFNCIRNIQTIKVNQNALDQSLKFLNRMQEWQKAGKATNLDIATAEAQVADRELALLNSKTRILLSLDSLKRLIGVPVVQEIKIFEDISLDVTIPVENFDQALEFAFANRSDYRIHLLDIELAKRELLTEKSKKRPDLSISYSASFYEEGESFSDAYSYSDRPVHNINLNFSMPFFRKNKITSYLTKGITLDKEEILLTERKENIKQTIKRIMLEIEQSLKEIEVQTKKVEIQDTRVKSFEARFDTGLVDSLEVTRAYDDLDRARIDLINSKLNLKSLVSELHFNLGSDPAVVIEDEKNKR